MAATMSSKIGDAERLRALLLSIPRRRALLLQGGTAELRTQMFEYISPRADVTSRFVPDLLALSQKEQGALRDEIADRRDPFIVVIGLERELAALLEDGLDSGLYFRLSGALSWTVKESDSVLMAAAAA